MSSEPRPMTGLNLSADQQRRAGSYDGSISHGTGTPPMTSDVKIPQWAEKVAQDFHDKWDTGMSGAAFRDLQRALLAAERRGLEKAADHARTFGLDYALASRKLRDEGRSDAADNHLTLAVGACRASAAIRSLGEKT